MDIYINGNGGKVAILKIPSVVVRERERFQKKPTIRKVERPSPRDFLKCSLFLVAEAQETDSISIYPDSVLYAKILYFLFQCNIFYKVVITFL